MRGCIFVGVGVCGEELVSVLTQMTLPRIFVSYSVWGHMPDNFGSFQLLLIYYFRESLLENLTQTHL